MTISGVRKGGATSGRAQCYRGVAYTVDLLPKVKIELVLGDDEAHCAAEILRFHSRTGGGGDGDVVVAPVDEVIRIRTGERDRDAVHHRRYDRVRLAVAR